MVEFGQQMFVKAGYLNVDNTFNVAQSTYKQIKVQIIKTKIYYKVVSPQRYEGMRYKQQIGFK